MFEIWTEKYRPKRLDEVIGQEHVVSRLKAFVKSKNIPNMLFAGPAGVGKTTCAIALARELYGEENWKQNFLETNASDERGINVIRGKIKEFARTKPIGDVGFKIIFLDESDALTQEAQQALRRTMEKYANTTRFILSCNYSSKIIPPIQSRCAVFRFKPIDPEKMKAHLKKICESEGIEVTEEGLDAVVRVSEGDMRQAINILQAVSITTKKLTVQNVYEVAASLKPEEVKEILELALKGNFTQARDKLIEVMVERGMSGVDVIKGIHREILGLNIEEREKAHLIDRLGEYEFRIVEGGSEDLQIEAFLAEVVALKSKLIR